MVQILGSRLDKSLSSDSFRRFNTEQMTKSVKSILYAQLSSIDAWPRDKDQQRRITKSICEQVKSKMLGR